MLVLSVRARKPCAIFVRLLFVPVFFVKKIQQTCLYALERVCVYVCACACACVCVYACVSVYMYVCVYLLRCTSPRNLAL